MDFYFTIKQMQRMNTMEYLWQRLTELHWQLVEILHLRIRLKYWILQATLGPKSLNILIMISKFFIILKTHIFVEFKIYFSITGYATVTTSQGALFIGGYYEGDVATVVCYNNSGWSKLDDLQSTRRYGRAIINGDKVYVIGGVENQ